MKKDILLFQESKNAGFRAERLRKNVKAALNENKIPFSTNKHDDNVSIAHLLYPFNEQTVNTLKENGKKIIMSVFYTEGEKNARLTNIGIIQDNHKFDIPNDTYETLIKADLILVPAEEYKNFLIKKGMEGKYIKIVSPSINNKIYKYLSERDMGLAKQYFSFHEETRILLAFGDYNDKVLLKRLDDFAISRPDIEIVYVCSNYIKETFLERHFEKNKTAKNLTITSGIDITVYRSLLKNVRAVILFNSYLADEIQILEAFAAEAQVIAIDEAIPRKFRNNLVIHAEDIKDVYKYLLNFLDYKISNTISKAYFYVEDNDVYNLGINLIKIYKELKEGC